MLVQSEDPYHYIHHFVISCSKCHTLKTSTQTVSVQVQPVRYQSQPGQDPYGYNPVNYHWARSHQLSVSIQTLAINRALNATEGHKGSYQTCCQCHTRTQAQLSNKLLINLYQILGYDLSLYVSMRTQLLYTVIKAEFPY